MKRDMDLARSILLSIEDSSSHGLEWIEIDIPGRTAEDVAYHVMILAEAGLVVAEELSDDDGFDYKPKRLTWAGHEFVDASRDESLWKKAKKLTLEKTGGLAFEILKTALIHYGKTALGIEK